METAGIVPLAHGETAVFTGLLAGTAYAVTETPPEGWRAVFAAAVTAEGATSPTRADGEVPVGGSVAVTVTNATYDYAISLPLTKTLLLARRQASARRSGSCWRRRTRRKCAAAGPRNGHHRHR